MTWTIVITALLTVLAVVVAMNFKTSEKSLERKIEHRYAVADPQFRREMGVMLGPGITAGNKVTDLQKQLTAAAENGPQASLRDIRPDVPSRWTSLVMSAMAVDPGRRIASARVV